MGVRVLQSSTVTILGTSRPKFRIEIEILKTGLTKMYSKDRDDPERKEPSLYPKYSYYSPYMCVYIREKDH